LKKTLIPYQYHEEAFLIRKIRKNFDALSIDEHPHRHGFYEFLYIESGTGKHEVDGITYDLEEHTFYIISKGQVHHFLFAKNVEGYLIIFQDNILPSVLSSNEGYYHNLLHRLSQQNVLFVELAARSLIDSLLLTMLQEYEGQSSNILDLSLIQHLLYPLLILLHRSAVTEIIKQDYQQEQYVQYINVLEQAYKQQHYLDFYAKELGLTKRRLSTICKEKTGKSAKKILNERILTEAKRFLKYTSLPLKEIADLLGFKTVAYFCRFFKKGVGETPSGYKELQI